MKLKLFSSSLLFIILSLPISIGFAQENEEAVRKLYQKAKKQSIAQKWDGAINLFQQLIDEHPNSQYKDDAYFWVAYCLEKRKDSEIDAFTTFERLVNNFPESPWVDDAIIHQISLAELFVRQGNEQYLTFLIEKLNNDEPTTRQQAALALGKLGDKRSLKTLNALKDDEDLGPLARYLIEKMESGQSTESRPRVKTEESEYLTFDVEGKRDMDKMGITKGGGPLAFRYTKRHKQYRDMLKEEGDWTKQELIDFGMWQILPTDQFEEYSSLEGYDRSEWLRKYWKLRDPTPTTDINESQIEIERRINYARAYFSSLWNYRHFRYLKDQYLRQSWPHAPWDARGEVYIKYGEPDSRTVSDYHKEEWIYNRYNFDLIINQYMTNIYGEAIHPGPQSQIIHNFHPEYVDANFIFHQEFRYHHDYESKPFKHFKLSIGNDYYDKEGIASFDYTIPTKEFKLTREKGQYSVRYLERVVVFDEDMREVYHNETTKEMTEKNKNAFKKEKLIKETITLNLNPGQYMIALRIEDHHSDRLGIYIENFDVKD